MSIFNLPDLGEGLQEAEIVEWSVQVGDTVKTDQTIIVIETDKASVEIPSPSGGKIIRLFGQPGDIIQVGNPLVEIEDMVTTEGEDENKTAREDSGTVVGRIETSEDVIDDSPTGIQASKSGQKRIKASPAVRALATSLGVDLNTVSPTGPKNTITKKDVTKVAENPQPQSVKPTASKPIGEPLKRARRSMALNMSKSHSEVALVTQMEDADISQWQNGDLTVRLVEAIVDACRAEPNLNAFYDHETLSLQTFTEVNLGIAVDTPEGLYVPVIKNAAQVPPDQVRETINRFKTKAREKAFQPEELRGATIILSNFGGIGGRYATPLVVPPMVAIIGVGRSRQQLAWVNRQPEPARMLPISLSFDHRAATGGEASRFLTTLIKSLEDTSN